MQNISSMRDVYRNIFISFLNFTCWNISLNTFYSKGDIAYDVRIHLIPGPVIVDVNQIYSTFSTARPANVFIIHIRKNTLELNICLRSSRGHKRFSTFWNIWYPPLRFHGLQNICFVFLFGVILDSIAYRTFVLSSSFGGY